MEQPVPTRPSLLGSPRDGDAFRSPGRVAKILGAVYVLELAASLFLAVLLWQVLTSIQELRAGQSISEEDWAALAGRFAELRTSLMVTGIIAIVGLAVWTHRVTANAVSFGRATSQSPGWAAASFFIPVLNWWWPYVAVTEAWDASDPDGGDPHRRGARGLLGAWWAFFLLSGWGTLIQGQVGRGDDLDAWVRDVRISLIALAVQMIATVLSLIVVRRLSRRQDERFRAPIPTATAL